MRSSFTKHRHLLWISLLVWLPMPVLAEPERTIRVAAFPYYPAIFQNQDGEVEGFYVDMLSEIAEKENLQFDYVFGPWHEGMEKIRTGDVDLLTSVAFTEDRAAFLDYGRFPLLTVWGELYVREESSLSSIREVDGKKIAVMKNDFNARHFIGLLDRFGFSYELLEFDDFAKVFSAVRAGHADAGVANVVFGGAKDKQYGLKSTGVLFNPFDIFFAVAKGLNPELLNLLDRYLEQWRGDDTSVYFQSRFAWSDRQEKPQEVIPAWIYKLSIFLGSAVVLCFVFIHLLRREVNRKTRLVRQREGRLRESGEMIRLLLNSTAEAIYGLDMDGRCTFCNQSCLQMLGYFDEKQLLGKNMHDLIHHSCADGSRIEVSDCRIFRAFRNGQKSHCDTEVLWRADGSSFPAEYWSYPIVRDGEIIGSVVTFIDIGERKEAENLLNEKNKEMEQFVYTVSHDLRSPLVTINTFLELLQQDMANNDVKEIEEDIRHMKAAGVKMEQLLNGILQLSRAGRFTKICQKVSLHDIIDESLVSVKGALLAKNVTVDIADPEIFLWGDPLRLSQIWQNIIDNAVKYSGEKQSFKIAIGIETSGADTIFYLRDNGIGIAGADQEKIFGLFEKLDRQTAGAGLGLALVKKIVESYGGRIWVESAGLSLGSCFKFTLPKALKPIEEETS